MSAQLQSARPKYAYEITCRAPARFLPRKIVAPYYDAVFYRTHPSYASCLKFYLHRRDGRVSHPPARGVDSDPFARDAMTVATRPHRRTTFISPDLPWNLRVNQTVKRSKRISKTGIFFVNSTSFHKIYVVYPPTWQNIIDVAYIL